MSSALVVIKEKERTFWVSEEQEEPTELQRKDEGLRAHKDKLVYESAACEGNLSSALGEDAGGTCYSSLLLELLALLLHL